MASKTTNKDTSVTSSRVDPNRVSGMPVLRHNISGKSTGAVSNWFECKSKWSPYLEGKFGRAGRVIKDGKFPIPEDVPEPRIPEDASTLAKRRIEEEYSLKVKARFKELQKFQDSSDQLFSFVWSHTSEESRALVESTNRKF